MNGGFLQKITTQFYIGEFLERIQFFIMKFHLYEMQLLSSAVLTMEFAEEK